MYSVDRIPDDMKVIFYANPMTPIIVAYRDILYYGNVPKMNTLLHATLVGIVLMIIGTVIFGRLKRHFAEEM